MIPRKCMKKIATWQKQITGKREKKIYNSGETVDRLKRSLNHVELEALARVEAVDSEWAQHRDALCDEESRRNLEGGEDDRDSPRIQIEPQGIKRCIWDSDSVNADM